MGKKICLSRRPDSVIFEAKRNTYSEVLALVTRKRRKTAGAGEERAQGPLHRDEDQSASLMKSDLEAVLDRVASVRVLTKDSRMEFLSISDLDPLVATEDLSKALGYPTAIVDLPCSEAQADLAKGKLKVGWKICGVKEGESTPRCFKCLELGHIAAQCKSPENRSGFYIKCGQTVHIVASCTQEAKCSSCTSARRADANHIAGSSSCPLS
ncbi:uncharacterized protein LOC122319577 [Drosophila yakuba]|uniref:uncharacterized protein LOC122319577 n=1 Tax=Drosophila yakuba TaxID=7245 RepID=UPI001C89D008|nr:uncharacterized protein LOC122319577 [Drosophila yakuba]